MLMGCLPQRWPIWLKPQLIDMTGPREGHSRALTQSLRTSASFLFPHPDTRSDMSLWSFAPRV
jgi:N-acyl homoserine lactone hydrolase